jgi:intein/homing endonuclease
MAVYEGLDDSWNVANEWVDQMPDHIIEGHKETLSTFFKRHAQVLKAEIQRRTPEVVKPIEYLDKTVEMIESGEIREGLRRLTIGIVEILPQSGKDLLDERYRGLFESAGYNDKAIVIMNSTEIHMPGLMPMTVRLIRGNDENLTAEEFYTANQNLILPGLGK